MFINMRVTFTYATEEIFKGIICWFIRPTVEFAAVVCDPHLKKKRDVNKTERVQKAETRWMLSLRDLGYEKRFVKLKLPALLPAVSGEEKQSGYGNIVQMC